MSAGGGLDKFLETFPKGEDGAPDLPTDVLQAMMATAIHGFVAACRQEGAAPAPLAKDSGITATEVAIVANALLEALDMDIFELQMWRSLGRRQ